jgi:hypothetical protein
MLDPGEPADDAYRSGDLAHDSFGTRDRDPEAVHGGIAFGGSAIGHRRQPLFDRQSAFHREPEAVSASDLIDRHRTGSLGHGAGEVAWSNLSNEPPPHVRRFALILDALHQDKRAVGLDFAVADAAGGGWPMHDYLQGPDGFGDAVKEAERAAQSIGGGGRRD